MRRHLPQLRQVFEETCAHVSQQLEEGARLVAGHQRNTAAETPRPSVPGPDRTDNRRPERNRDTGGATVRAAGAQEVPPSRVEKLIEEAGDPTPPTWGEAHRLQALLDLPPRRPVET